MIPWETIAPAGPTMNERAELQSDEVERRVIAAEKLSRMGSDAAPAAVELVVACADDERVRDPAIAALEELGSPPLEALPRLAELVADNNTLVVHWAITLLGRAGTAAKFSEPNLVSVLTSSPVMECRSRAAWALEKIDADSDAAMRAMQQAADSSDPRLSRLAKSYLTQIKTSPSS